MRKAAVATAAGLPLVVAASLIAIAGCDSGSGQADSKPDRAELSVNGSYLPKPAMADMAAAYFTVKNDGGKADRLTSVSSPLSPDVTMHVTEGSQMKQATSLDVPAGGKLTLSRGGNHLMLGKLDHLPKVGEKVEFTLHFAESKSIKVQVPVEPPTYRPED
ncbi:copper chaperone PCu(A)C [Streptomyces varsoviensis]|uniref:Lipoprotein n=1 Tax=Streptomyces varsoviensis TaxID=67373 RepID=A0ABR5J9L0_9ACTN|nr:copper chaperone PCu(A)C [Streptomyces varsoviensis]KOG90013.1 lipoprotein [Streptomyces varsoviensis]